MSKHTPGLLHIDKHVSNHIVSESGRSVATTGGYTTNADGGKYIEENEANAQRILDCWNALADLDPSAVATMREALEKIANGNWFYDEDAIAISEKALVAIKKLEETK
jgi:hypothetical protein